MWCRQGGLVARRGGHQAFNCWDGLDAASGSGFGAVQGCGGAGEIELALEWPALEQSVDEAGVEDVSCAGGVGDGDAVGGGVVELLAIPGEDAFFAERGGGEAVVVAAVYLAQGRFEAGFGHQAAREIAADDQVVDVFEKGFYAGVELVEIGDNGDAGVASPLCGLGGGGGVEAVHVEDAGVDDPFLAEFFGLEDESGIALAEDGAFALGVDEDDGLRTGALGDGDELGLDAGAGELAAVEIGGFVLAELADVSGAQSPVLAGYDRGGYLSAGEDGGGSIFDFGALRGVMRERDQGVGCVEPYADQVDYGLGCCGLRHLFHYNWMGLGGRCLDLWSETKARLARVGDAMICSAKSFELCRGQNAEEFA